MALKLPKKKIDYLVLGIIAGVIAGIIIYILIVSSLETAQGVRGAAINALTP